MCTFEMMQEQAKWMRTPAGRLAHVQKRRMVEMLFSAWPRRGHSILEVGCGGEMFLDLLWEAGFDPTGTAESPELLDSIRKHLGSKVDLHFCKPDSLPFDNDEFDYVALFSALDVAKDPALVLSEAFRVAAKGVLLVFNNYWSLAALQRQLCKGQSHLTSVEYYSLPQMLSLIRSIAPQNSISCRSTLFGPVNFWREKGPLSVCSRLILPLPLGASLGLRVDIAPAATGTLLPLSVNYMPPAGTA